MDNKCSAIKNNDKLVHTNNTNNTLTAIKLALLEKLSMQNFTPNDEIYITESGDFTVPFTGEYEVTVIGGGCGTTTITSNLVNNCPILIAHGSPGDRVTRLVYLEKDQVVPVVIGAGSANVTLNPNVGGSYAQPTVSSFGDIKTYRYWEYDALSADEKRTRSYEGWVGGYAPRYTSVLGNVGEYSIAATGYGAGGGSGYEGGGTSNARGYGCGAGAGVVVRKNDSGVWQVTTSSYGQAKQGCVILKFFNPEKVSFPSIDKSDLLNYLIDEA